MAKVEFSQKIKNLCKKNVDVIEANLEKWLIDYKNRDSGKIKYADHVYLYEHEYMKLVKNFGMDKVNQYIHRISLYQATHKRYDGVYYAIIYWITNANSKDIKSKLSGNLDMLKDLIDDELKI